MTTTGRSVEMLSTFADEMQRPATPSMMLCFMGIFTLCLIGSCTAGEPYSKLSPHAEFLGHNFQIDEVAEMHWEFERYRAVHGSSSHRFHKREECEYVYRIPVLFHVIHHQDRGLLSPAAIDQEMKCKHMREREAFGVAPYAFMLRFE